MCESAAILQDLGYKESSSKPNLFFRKNEFGVFFADMRGTEIVKIWEDPSPLFYWDISESIPDWKKRRMIKEELRRLASKGCRCRLSFYQECEPEGLMFDSDEDGFCNYCGKDFQDYGHYCSAGCEEKARRDSLPECSVCHQKMNRGSLIKHHISYYPEETILVCRACHHRVHNAYRWNLKPPKEHVERFYRKHRRDEGDKGRKGRKERYYELFEKGYNIKTVAEEMNVKVSTAERWHKAWRMKRCENCGEIFDSRLRTTCPRCRTFFR